jgi:hypothetical protein
VLVPRHESTTLAGLFARGPLHASIQGIMAKERREPRRGFYVAVYNKGGKQKIGVLEDTLMSEKEARERAGRL